MTVQIKVTKLHPKAVLPTYAHTGTFADLAADLFAVTDDTVAPREVRSLKTGLAMEFPSEFGALVEDRSGLASKGVSTLAGVIDPGYRGEICVVIVNLGEHSYTFKAGDRIAQLRIVRRIDAIFVEDTRLAPSERGTKGFGSTGAD